MPGGVIKGAYWSPPYPLYFDRAKDCNLWDLDGNRYLDFANHHTAMVLGHSYPAVVEAVQKEVERGFGLGGPTTLEAEIAEEIVGRVPSVEKVRYTNSGTEATLQATRVVRAVSGKPKIAKFEGAFHGAHDALEYSVGAVADPTQAGPADAPVPVPSHLGMTAGADDQVVVLPYNDPETVELILREHQDELAAVIYDGKPAALEVPYEFSQFIRDVTRELGIYLVADEVVGFMAGPGGYQVEAGIEPDLTCYGKILGGGFPAGALGGKNELMDVLDNSGPPTGISQSGTFAGNNFTLAAGLATLRSLTPEVYEHLAVLRERLHVGMQAAYDEAGIPCRVISAGSIVNAFLTERPVRNARDMALVDSELFDRICFAMTMKGYNLGRGNMSHVLSAPMTEEHIDGYLASLHEVLSEV